MISPEREANAMASPEKAIDAKEASHASLEKGAALVADSVIVIGDDKSAQNKDNTDQYQQSTCKRRKVLLRALVVAIVVIVAVVVPVVFVLMRSDSVPVFSYFLPRFGTVSLESYEDCADLRRDIYEAAKYLSNVEIHKNARRYNQNEEGAKLARENAPNSAYDAKGGGEDSYQTNNQVEGVDEADLVKSDGAHVFAAYGNDLVVWNVTHGIEISRTAMPPAINNRNTRIEGLLLNENRLVAIVGEETIFGYWYHRHSGGDKVLSGAGATRLFTYDISNIPTNGTSIPLLYEKSLQGRYMSARSIGPHGHVVTTSYVNAYKRLTRYLDPYNSNVYPKGMSKSSYRKKAYNIAKEKIPDFVQQLTSELMASGNNADGDESGKCDHVARISVLQSSKLGNEEGGEVLEFTDSGVLNSLAQITSFDMQQHQQGGRRLSESSTGTVASLSSSVSAAFLPTSYLNTYASEERLVLAGQGWDQDKNGDWSEGTYLMGFRLENATSSAVSIGHVPGYLLNQFSMDHYHDVDDGVDYLRVATTNRERWGLVDQKRRVWGQVLESSSQVTVLRFPQETNNNEKKSEMKVVGKVTGLGKSERIYAVRFVGLKGFVVTFRQTDPFYTLDLSDPTNPQVVGELKIPGFSNYLHPINSDANLILAVGQHADESTGFPEGLQIALFDVTDLANPIQVQKYVAESDDRTSSWSDAQYDHRAFRYLPQSQVLILPVKMYSWYGNDDNFDGFLLYDINATAGIDLRFEIVHADSYAIRGGCWSSTYIPARSFVFDGNVMTMKGHTVLSHDLETEAMEWTVPLKLDRKDTKCSNWF